MITPISALAAPTTRPVSQDAAELIEPGTARLRGIKTGEAARVAMEALQARPDATTFTVFLDEGGRIVRETLNGKDVAEADWQGEPLLQGAASSQSSADPAAPAGPPTPVAAAAATYCTVTVTPPEKSSVTPTLDWSIASYCYGNYGVQGVGTWLQRSSWSGYRSYTNAVHSPYTAYSRLYTDWEAKCPMGRSGTYDYRAVAITDWTGGATGRVYSSAKRWACGTGVS